MRASAATGSGRRRSRGPIDWLDDDDDYDLSALPTSEPPERVR